MSTRSLHNTDDSNKMLARTLLINRQLARQSARGMASVAGDTLYTVGDISKDNSKFESNLNAALVSVAIFKLRLV